MKKAITLILALVLSASLTACGGASSGDASSAPPSGEAPVTTNTPNDTPEPAETTEPTPTAEPKTEGEGDIGDFHIVIKSGERSTDYAGADCVVITYEWTNNSDKAASFMTTFSVAVFQNDIECESGIAVEGADSGGLTKDIRPGATFEVKQGYVLNDTTSPIEVEVTEWITFASDPPVITKTFTFN
ncbi:MAG: DUF5067 domain-containing protein [Oscillospiraceae bacterium]|jgi:hypothetical protein|nr:DUF5067 domain-containing protein [Oscillospiraceae bacterium]